MDEARQTVVCEIHLQSSIESARRAAVAFVQTTNSRD